MPKIEKIEKIEIFSIFGASGIYAEFLAQNFFNFFFCAEKMRKFWIFPKCGADVLACGS